MMNLAKTYLCESDSDISEHSNDDDDTDRCIILFISCEHIL